MPPATSSSLVKKSTLVAVDDESLVLTAVAETQVLNERVFLLVVIR